MVDEELIDEDWINEIENREQLYDVFCRDNIDNIDIVFLYVKENNIVLVKKKNILLKENTIENNNIIDLIIKYKKVNNKKYKVKHVFSYNFNLDNIDNLSEENVINFIKEESIHKPIILDKSIKYFEKLNSIYFVMEERKPSRLLTKRSYVSPKNKTRRN